MSLEALRIETADLSAQLRQHPVYAELRGIGDLRFFMSAHVFCVWDFMSLLMALRDRVSGRSLPWIPRGAPEDRRLLNEIVRDEESDIGPDGEVRSHLELYLDAMRAAGADRAPIDRCLAALSRGSSLEAALSVPDLPEGVQHFVDTTFSLAVHAPLHALAAVFYSSREAVIPPIFVQILDCATAAEESSGRADGSSWELFRFYLERHIEVDDAEHQHAAGRIVERACGDSAERWSEAIAASQRALGARLELWNCIRHELAKRRKRESVC